MKTYEVDIISRPLGAWKWAKTRATVRVVAYDAFRHRIAVLAGRSKATRDMAIRRAGYGMPWARVVAESGDVTLDYEGGEYGYRAAVEAAKALADTFQNEQA